MWQDPKSQFFDLTADDNRLFRSSIIDPDIAIGGELRSQEEDSSASLDYDEESPTLAEALQEDWFAHEFTPAPHQDPHDALTQAKNARDSARLPIPTSRRCRSRLPKSQQYTPSERAQVRAWLRDDPTRVILFRETLPDHRLVKGPTHDQQKLTASYYRYHGWKDGSVEHQVYRHAQTIAEYFAIARSNKGHHDYPTNASALDNKIIADFLHDAERGFVIWPEFPADGDAVQQSPVHDPESVDFQQFALSNDSPVDSIQELIFNTTTPPDVQRMEARLDNHSFLQQMAFESFVQMRQDIRSRRSGVTNMVNLTDLGDEYLALTTKPERR